MNGCRQNESPKRVQTVQNCSKQICGCILIWEDNRRWTFTLHDFTQRYYGLWTHILATVWSQKHLDGFVFTNAQPLASQDVNWWTGVVWTTCGLLWCFYQLFGLSFWRHPFTVEYPLLSKWCNAIFLQIWWRNKLIYILDGLSCFNYYYYYFLTVDVQQYCYLCMLQLT